VYLFNPNQFDQKEKHPISPNITQYPSSISTNQFYSTKNQMPSLDNRLPHDVKLE